jgi:16S rRNA processing protein RimM
MTYDDWSLTIGEIVAPFGLKGEVKVRLETDFPDRFKRLPEVCLRQTSGKAALYVVEGARNHKGLVLLKLRGIDSIDTADTLRNRLVQIRGSEAVRLPRNEFYIHDAVGCDVYTESGLLLGPLTAVLRSPANDVFVVGSGKSEILLPVISDVVREVDTAARRIIVAPTPGLLPEAESEQA